MKKADIILLIIVLLLGGVGTVLLIQNNEKAGFVSVVVEGEETERYSLNEDRDIIITTRENGENLLRIENGRVKMISANCPNQDCVNHNEIMNTNESIICLPHKIAITICGENNIEIPDGIVY